MEMEMRAFWFSIESRNEGSHGLFMNDVTDLSPRVATMMGRLRRLVPEQLSVAIALCA